MTRVVDLFGVDLLFALKTEIDHDKNIKATQTFESVLKMQFNL